MLRVEVIDHSGKLIDIYYQKLLPKWVEQWVNMGYELRIRSVPDEFAGKESDLPRKINRASK